MSTSPPPRPQGVTAGPRPQARSRGPGGDKPPSPWKKIALAVLAFLLLLGGAVWVWAALRGDPVLAQAKEMREYIRSDEFKELPKEERDAKFQEFREITNSLTPEQRFEFEAERRQKQYERLREDLQKTPEQLQAEMDTRLDRMQNWMQQRAAGGGGGPGGGGGQGGPGGGQGGGGPGAGGGGGGGGPGAGGGGGGGPGGAGGGGGWGGRGGFGAGFGGPGGFGGFGGGGGPGGPGGAEGKDARRQQMIEHMPGDLSSQMSDNRLQMRLQMQQRGINMGGVGGRGPGGGMPPPMPPR